MNIADIQDEIIEEFQLFPDWESKYEYVLEMGNKLEPLDLVDGKMHFNADGETAIARGILALVLRVLNDQKPEDILNTQLYFLERIGLKDHLSITRAQGLESLIKKIYQLASQYPHD
jgi:cysteine desulfuration protein SufE